MSKFESAYKTIGEVVEIIGLKSKRGDTSPTHTLRYWEKEFGSLFNVKKTSNQRIFKKNDIVNFLKIKSLIKKEGMTIKGAKSKIKKFEVDTKSSTNVLPILKSILKELKK